MSNSKKPLKFEVRVYGTSGIVIHTEHYTARNLQEATRMYCDDTFATCTALGCIGSVRFIIDRSV